MILYRLNNPGTGMDQDNAYQLARGLCCDGQGTICQDVLVLSALGTITSITVKNRAGGNVVTTVSGITNKATLRAALITAIQAAGGFLSGGGLDIAVSGNQYTITGMGEVQLVSLENGATRTWTHNCTAAYSCAVQLFIPYSTGSIALYNGTAASLGTVAAATATATIKGILDGITTPVANTVTASVGRGGFIVTATVPSTANYFINNTGPEIRNCTPLYTT